MPRHSDSVLLIAFLSGVLATSVATSDGNDPASPITGYKVAPRRCAGSDFGASVTYGITIIYPKTYSLNCGPQRFLGFASLSQFYEQLPQIHCKVLFGSRRHTVSKKPLTLFSPVYFSGNVTFLIPTGLASDKFSVSHLGQVTLQGPLDREIAGHYSVPILARSAKLLDLTTLEVRVLDENDNAPVFRLGPRLTLAIPENQELSVVYTIAADDADEGKNGEIFYSIVGE